jgi:hypothetical protein
MYVSFVIEPQQPLPDSFSDFSHPHLEPDQLKGTLCLEQKRQMLPLRGDLLTLLPQFLEAVYDQLTGMQSKATLTGENGTLTLTRSRGSVRVCLGEGENRKPLQMRVNLRTLAAASVKGVEAFQSQVRDVASALTLHPTMQRIVSLQHTLAETLTARERPPLRQRLSAYLPSQPPRTLNALFVCLLTLIVFQTALLWRSKRASHAPLIVDPKALEDSPYRQNKKHGDTETRRTAGEEKGQGKSKPDTAPPLPHIPGGQIASPPVRYSGAPDPMLPPGGMAPMSAGMSAMGASQPQPSAPPSAKLVGVIEYNGESLAVLEMGNSTVYKKPGDTLTEGWKVIAVLENRVELQRTPHAGEEKLPPKVEKTTLGMGQ